MYDDATRTKWNYTFQWTDQHMTPEQMYPLRYKYDKLGANALEKLQKISSQKIATKDCPVPRLDLYKLLRDNHASDPVLNDFWTQCHTIPDWVDWDQLERGQKVFYRYAIANLTGFALQGFVGENSAASGVVEVLVRTGGFSTKVLLHRLMETFQWLLQVTRDLASIQPGGEGHASTIRVRLLHASVRQRIMKLAHSRPNYFNVEKFGVPVNTLDSIHSITTFSCNPMWFQLHKMGITVKQQEIDDYIALFRYIAYLLATPTEYFETSEKAKAIMESMYLHELEVTPTSRVVGFNFVKCLEDLPPMNISKEFIEAGSRWFNGNQLCDALELGRPGWYHYFCMMGLNAIVITLCFWQRLIPSFDSFMIGYMRNTLYNVIVLSKAGLGGGTVFDFKYVPGLDKSTGKERLPSHAKRDKLGKLSRPAELFLFVAFLLGCGLAVGTAAMTVKVARLLY